MNGCDDDNDDQRGFSLRFDTMNYCLSVYSRIRIA